MNTTVINIPQRLHDYSPVDMSLLVPASFEIIIGDWYHLTGDLANGYYADGTPCITHEEVTRRIVRVTQTHVICECGRRFIINENLTLKHMDY